MASIGKDLAELRKEQDLTIDDIHSVTKIPKHILESIENDSIFDTLKENPTYIRSYIRSYAKALSIDEDHIIYALDRHEAGRYAGSLRKSPEELPSSFEQEEKSDSDGEEKISEKSNSKEEKGGQQKEHSSPIPPEPVPSKEVSSPTNVHSVDWADMGRRFQPLQSQKTKIWTSIIAIVVVAAGIFTFFYFYSSSETQIPQTESTTEEQPKTEKPISTDSLQLDIATPDEDSEETVSEENGNGSGQRQALQTLPDTLDLVIFAAYGKLEPIRVETDISGDVNPYWLEEGEAMPFEFVNEIRIRGQLSRVVLLLNGHIVPNFREQFYNQETRMVEIEREYFEGDNRWLQPPPDSLGLGLPAPILRERPTFN